MKIAAYFLTCPSRFGSLNESVVSLRQSDFGHGAVSIFNDHEPLADPKASQTANAKRLLEQARKDAAEFILFLEDDVQVNRHLVHNLETWDLLPSLQVATLYSSVIRSEIDAFGIGGSQAILIRRTAIETILGAWDGYKTEMQDLRIFRTIGGQIPIHQPNLIQHRAEPSTWNGPSHSSPTFDENWKR